MKYERSLSFARSLDRKDPLRKFRSEFLFPGNGKKRFLYLCGNSLGLQPKNTRKYILEELNDWAEHGVDGHFHSRRPWLYYHKFFKKPLTKLTGAKPDEVVAMNQLTVNLHLMLTSFYQPTDRKFKIITEAGAFSSDQYAFESQIKLHGLDPDRALIELAPRAGEHYLRTEDITTAIKRHADELSLVIFGGVQYYSGQFFDFKTITNAAHEAGAYAGFDLAHAIGNVPLNLHHDGVDFAVWCGYKYLNSGPGGMAGAFIHNRHANSKFPRLAGWWGHQEKVRFQMKKGFDPIPGADGWQVSNFPVFSGAAHLASLDIFERATMPALRRKSLFLTGFLEYLLHESDPEGKFFTIITPADPTARGCQLSILMKKDGKKVFKRLEKEGVITDWREPDVIRVAPVPLYNTFEEVYQFTEIFKRALL